MPIRHLPNLRPTLFSEKKERSRVYVIISQEPRTRLFKKDQKRAGTVTDLSQSANRRFRFREYTSLPRLDPFTTTRPQLTPSGRTLTGSSTRTIPMSDRIKTDR